MHNPRWVLLWGVPVRPCLTRQGTFACTGFATVKDKRIFPVFILLLLFLLNFFVSCARLPYSGGGNVEMGVASWYGPGFQGKATSSREIYDMHDMTAAHRTLSFGTYVMVTNLDNGKSVIVRVNDRGPFVKDRIIDLSYAAARLLDMVGPGTAPVKVEVLADFSPRDSGRGFSVQIGSFSSRENAEALKKRLENKYRAVEVSEFKTPQQVYYRVRIKARDRETAYRTAQVLSEDGYTVLILEEQ